MLEHHGRVAQYNRGAERWQYLDRWLVDSVKDTVKETTYANYSYITRKHICPALGHVKLKSLTPAHVRSFYAEKTRSDLSPATVKKMHVVLRKAFKQAVLDGLVPRNVCEAVKPPKVERKDINPLDREQAKALLEEASGDRLEALYVLAVHTGMREGELLGLANWRRSMVVGTIIRTKGSYFLLERARR